MILAMNIRVIFKKNDRRGEISTSKVNSAEIENSYKLLTDRAKIVLPRNVRFFDKNKVGEVFRRGDEVEIELGYNGNLVSEFKGYVTQVSASIPIVIKCEDEMWKLKQLPVNVSLRSTTLPRLMEQIATGYKVNALEVELGKVRFSNTTLAKVLDTLKKEFGLFGYFQNGTLVVGKIFSDNNEEAVTYHLEKNVVSNRLNYRRAEDIRAKVKAVSVLADGSKKETEVGDEDGTIHQLSYYGISSEEELGKLARNDLDKIKEDGYEGSITVFGIPYVQHGMKANIISDRYPDRNGLYYVESVKVIFNDDPSFRRKVQISKKV